MYDKMRCKFSDTAMRKTLAMKERTGKKGGGGRLGRTEVVTVRLDPQMRYLAELAARKQRRTVSSFIEWAIQDCLKREMLGDSRSIMDEAAILWDVYEPDRFIALARHYPELMTHDEQVMWKLISENDYLWERYQGFEGREPLLLIQRLRDHWLTFKEVSEGEAHQDSLPDATGKSSQKAGSDGEIPF
jgi:hypothetical protein